MVIKYLIWPYAVTSINDGDRHYISGSSLIRLYGLNPHECIIVDKAEDIVGIDTEGLLDLYPDFSGRYKLPEPEQNTLVDNAPGVKG